jgi:endoglucanase
MNPVSTFSEAAIVITIFHRAIQWFWALSNHVFMPLVAIGTVVIVIVSSCGQTPSANPRPTPDQLQTYILVDQFGYRLLDPKVAIIVQPPTDPETNDRASFPRLSDSYQVIRVDNQQSIYEAKAEVWQDGLIHQQSGDRAAWFDFSSVERPGVYIIRNSRTGDPSATFEISEDVYRKLLTPVTRMFYYQRSGFSKQPPYADPRWTDEAAFLGPGQDTEAHFVNDKSNNNLVRDMRGGWFDAGDTNKYVTFAATAIHQLLDAYHENPELWTDNFNIPESGNGTPDLIDEIIYELDWLKRMQDDDGGVFIKIGTLDYQLFEKPSMDNRPRFYGPKCSSSTIAAAGMFAHAALVLKDLPSHVSYAGELRERAIIAWSWYQSNERSDSCDDQEIKSGDADRSLEEQTELSIAAAIYLAAITQDLIYKNYIDSHIDLITDCLYCNDTWYPYHVNFADALLYYIGLPSSNLTIRERLQESLSQLVKTSPTYASGDERDPYRAYMPDEQYHWGSNAIKALYGISNCDVKFIGIDADSYNQYQGRCLDALHYFHGVNPLGLVYLSNMYAYGAEHSVNELHHGWFDHGIYDNALTSPNGPAPGYITGGPNRNYTGSAQIDLRYPMKAYLDSNNKSHDMRMWEITEPAIYYQSAYLKLLSRLCNQT